MPTLFHNPPSGPEVSGVAQTTDEVRNTSSAPGLSFSDALDGIDTRIDTFETVLLVDEFLGGIETVSGTSSIGTLGDLGWSFFAGPAGGVVSRPTNNPNYFGALSLLANANEFAAIGLTPSSLSINNGLLTSLFTFVEFLGTPRIGITATAGSYRYGLGSDLLVQSLGNSSLFLEVDTGINGNWRFISRNTGVNTIISSAVPFIPDTLQRLRLERDTVTGSWTASINGVAIGTFTAAQVNGGTSMVPAVQVQAAVQAKALAIDRFSMGFNTVT